MDTIEAKKNLEIYKNNLSKLQSLSRGLMAEKEMLAIDAKIQRHKQQVRNIISNHHA